MEGFEHLVKVALEAEEYVVSGNVKFPVRMRTRKKIEEWQTHGYEIDLVGARQDSLVLASVKSFFGSRGVSRQGFRGIADTNKKTHYPGYKLFNEDEIRQGVIERAATRFGYETRQVELRLYVGKFSSGDEEIITNHLQKIHVGRGPIKVIGLDGILKGLFSLLDSKTYFNDPVIVTLKALKAAGRFHEALGK